MLAYDGIIKNSKAYNVVAQDLKTERVSHAYLFVSPDENYLYKFCETICKLFINHNSDIDSAKNNLRIEKLIHPDVKFFGTDKKIDVDMASEIVEMSNLSPFESDKKIFVLLNVNDMNEASQNKILKTIEEPPRNTYFILSAKSTSKILQTILSRVKQIELDELLVSQIEKLLIDKGVDVSSAQVYASCSNGDGEFAEKLATNTEFLNFFNQIVNCFFELNKSRDVVKFSSIFNAKSVDKKEFIDIFILICRDIALTMSANDQIVLNKNILPKLKVIASMLNYSAVCELIKFAIEQKKNLEFNVNGTAVIDSILFKLAEVKIKCKRL